MLVRELAATLVPDDNAPMSDSRPGLTIDSPIVVKLLPRLPMLFDAVLDAGLAAIPGGEALPDRHFHDEVVPAIVGCVTVFLSALEQGRACTEREIADIMAPVVERHAEDRLPVRLLVEGFYGSVRRIWAEIRDVAEPADTADFFAFSELLLDLMAHVTTTTVETYSEVEQSIYGAEREARRTLCAALLHTAPAAELAELTARANVSPDESFDVLAIQLPPLDFSNPAVTNAVSRKRIRLVQRALDGLAGSTALHTFDGVTGIALLPVSSEPAKSPYQSLSDDLAATLGGPVTIIDAGSAPRGELEQAAAEATELAELATALRLPTGTHRPVDLMLESQLARPGRARDRLAQCVLPLLPHPHLMEALEAHIRHGADRKAAAGEVHLHPNSFTYRLRRVAELTGFDPADPKESRLLAAALMIHRLYPSEETTEPGSSS